MKDAPDYIQFYPTLRCNRSCPFCFNRGLSALPDMALDQFRRMLATLAKAGIATLDIIGGEPTLHPDIVTMVSDAEQCGMRVNLSSNGDDPHTLERILATAKRTTVGISINDRDTLDRLQPFISQHQPVVKSVYHPSIDSGFVEKILVLKPARFYLLYRDALDHRELSSSVPFDRFLKTVQEQFGSSIGTVFCSGFLPDTESYPGLAKVRCPAGTTKLGVMPDGSVYPCNLFFGKKEFRLGNILKDPFERIWGDARLGFFRTFSRNACPRTSCTIHDSCHGGCPAHGLIHGNDLSAPDPRCAAPPSSAAIPRKI
jgi:radical SAM protein with 4Fe4S-binding SPASM domain